MTKKLKTFNVALQYEVQKIYTVSAKNQEEAEQLVMNGKGYSEKSDEDWRLHNEI
jgi:ectoine hydroxylase-related dioxygenase (phytanoyl-CoA dioxygenase family)